MKKLFLIIFILLAFNIYPTEKIYDLMTTEELKQEETRLESVLKSDANNYDTLVQLGILCHSIAGNDEKNYALKAINYFEKAINIKYETYVNAYQGSAYTLMANEVENPFDKLKYVNKGFKIMDESITNNPADFSSRLIRFYNSLSVPDFLNRKKQMDNDFEYLSGIYKNDKTLTQGQKARILLAAGQYYIKIHKNNDALKSWQTLVDSYTGATKYLVVEAESMINKYKNN